MPDAGEDNSFIPDLQARLETGIGRSKWFELDRQGVLPKAIYVGRKKLRVRQEMRKFRDALIEMRESYACRLLSSVADIVGLAFTRL